MAASNRRAQFEQQLKSLQDDISALTHKFSVDEDLRIDDNQDMNLGSTSAAPSGQYSNGSNGINLKDSKQDLSHSSAHSGVTSNTKNTKNKKNTTSTTNNSNGNNNNINIINDDSNQSNMIGLGQAKQQLTSLRIELDNTIRERDDLITGVC